MPAMWDRLRTGGSRDNIKSSSWRPYSQTTGALEIRHQNQNLGQSLGAKGGQAPPRPPREVLVQDNLSAFPAPLRTPFTASASRRPPQAIYNPRSKPRPVSSIYSQPDSPPDDVFSPEGLSESPVEYHGRMDEISPPSSPDLAADTHQARDVSPIDEHEDDIDRYFKRTDRMAASSPASQPRLMGPVARNPIVPDLRSNIPVMRRERRQADLAGRTPGAGQPPRQRQGSEPRPVGRPTNSNTSGDYGKQERRGPIKVDPRWDPMTGERTTSDRGKPSQVDPVQYAKGISTRGTPRDTSMFGERVKTRRPTPQQREAVPSPAARSAVEALKADVPAANEARQPDVRDSPEPPEAAYTTAPLAVSQESQDSVPQSATSDAAATESGPDPLKIFQAAASRNAARVASPIASPRSIPSPVAYTTTEITGGAAKSPTSPPGTKGGFGGFASKIRQIIPSSQSWPKAQSKKAEAESNDSAQTSSQNNNNLQIVADDAETAKASRNDKLSNEGHAIADPAPLSLSPSAVDGDDKAPLPSPATQGPVKRKPAPPSAHANASAPAHSKQGASISSSVYSQLPDSSAAPPLPTEQAQTLPSGEKVADDPNWMQPPSRFSVTTYAPSSIGTPRESLDEWQQQDHPPLPAQPADFASKYSNNGNSSRPAPVASGGPTAPTPVPVQPTQQPSQPLSDSVMGRTRPKMLNDLLAEDWDDESPKDTVKISLSKAWMSSPYANSAGMDTTQVSPPRARKEAAATHKEAPAPRNDVQPPRQRGPRVDRRQELPSQTSQPLVRVRERPQPVTVSKPMPIRTESFSPTDKSLPQAPPEISADKTQDRIASLNAQLRSLGNRRININRSIKQMTELMPADNLMAAPEVLRKRAMEKKKVETLRMELAEVQREEHELGMKLHRAYKRLDQGADFEPTTLWVRRATG